MSFSSIFFDYHTANIIYSVPCSIVCLVGNSIIWTYSNYIENRTLPNYIPLSFGISGYSLKFMVQSRGIFDNFPYGVRVAVTRFLPNCQWNTFQPHLKLKPHLGLLILVALVAGRRWKSCGAIIVATLSLVIVSTWVIGIDTWIAYFKNISLASSILKNESAVWDRMPTIFALVRLQGGSLWLALVLQFIMMGVTIRLLSRSGVVAIHCPYVVQY